MPDSPSADRRPNEPRGLLRRWDQVFLAGVLVAIGLAVAVWWSAAGGRSTELVEWNDCATGEPVRFEVDVNAAPWPELIQLPDIGETLARRIVASRETEGPFASPEDLLRVHGIGEKTLNQLRPFLDSDYWESPETDENAVNP